MNAGNEPTAAAAMPLRFPHPIDGLAGTSFKHEHLPAILAEGPQRGFFEVHAENYIGAVGPPHRALETNPSRPSGFSAWRMHVDRRTAAA